MMHMLESSAPEVLSMLCPRDSISNHCLGQMLAMSHPSPSLFNGDGDTSPEMAAMQNDDMSYYGHRLSSAAETRAVRIAGAYSAAMGAPCAAAFCRRARRRQPPPYPTPPFDHSPRHLLPSTMCDADIAYVVPSNLALIDVCVEARRSDHLHSVLESYLRDSLAQVGVCSRVRVESDLVQRRTDAWLAHILHGKFLAAVDYLYCADVYGYWSHRHTLRACDTVACIVRLRDRASFGWIECDMFSDTVAPTLASCALRHLHATAPNQVAAVS